MKSPRKGNELTAVLQRLDSRSPDAFIQSLAEEISRLHSAVASLEGRLAAMETLAKLADHMVADFPIPAPASAARLEVVADSSSLEFIGFYEMEYDEKGSAFRWTGPERHFSFQLFLDRRAPLGFALTYREIFADEPPERLRSFVDGKEVEVSVRRGIEGYVASGVLPPRKDGGGTVLTFVVPAVLSPSARGQSDERLLGLKFLNLVVEPSLGPGGEPLPDLTFARVSERDESQYMRDVSAKPVEDGTPFGLGKRITK